MLTREFTDITLHHRTLCERILFLCGTNYGGQVNPPEAEEAVVAFTVSGFEQRWSKGDTTLLELAEAHGLNPAYGCRSGSCGSCAVRVAAGAVTCRTEPTVEIAPDEALESFRIKLRCPIEFLFRHCSFIIRFCDSICSEKTLVCCAVPAAESDRLELEL